MMECDATYGVLPCSDTVVGNLFLLLVYGFFMLKSAQLLSNGSEMLLTVLDPGTIGGLVLPILGALPDALLILVSGLAGSKAEAQSQVSVGMGLLAGSTIMLLTLLWGSSLIVGRCDLYPVNETKIVAKDRTLTRGFSLAGVGITTDSQTKVGAWIMIVTVIPYFVAQLPHILRHPSYATVASTVGCVLAFLGLFAYCAYQVVSPWLQKRKIYVAKHHWRRSHALHRVSLYSDQQSWGSLLLEDGAPNKQLMLKIFGYFDENQDGLLSEKELRGFIVGLGICHETHLPEEEEVQNWLREFDASRDNHVSQDEFVNVLTKWMRSLRSKRIGVDENAPDYWHSRAEDARTSLDALLEEEEDREDEQSDEDVALPLTKRQVIIRASALMLAGAALAGVVADPLVDAIDNFSKASGIPTFFVAFIATPLATNSSEAVSSIIFAARKRKRNISMTYSQIYGAVTMNNTLCLGVFLAIVAVRQLTWDFSSEVLVISVVTLIVGVLGGSKVTFRLWSALLVLLLYPLSIGLVAFLDYALGWH